MRASVKEEAGQNATGPSSSDRSVVALAHLYNQAMRLLLVGLMVLTPLTAFGQT